MALIYILGYITSRLKNPSNTTVVYILLKSPFMMQVISIYLMMSPKVHCTGSLRQIICQIELFTDFTCSSQIVTFRALFHTSEVIKTKICIQKLRLRFQHGSLNFQTETYIILIFNLLDKPFVIWSKTHRLLFKRERDRSKLTLLKVCTLFNL